MSSENHTFSTDNSDFSDSIDYPDSIDLSDSVDDEDTGRGDDVVPWDPSKIRISTKHFSLRDVVDQIADEEIDLVPDFQRDYVWKPRQKTRLVESILLGIPLPAFYFNQADDGTYQVVDGVQRLSTVSLFMRDKHTLDKADLEYLTHLHGLKYSELDPASLRRFRSAQIVVHVIEPQTPDEVKYDIFNRVNTSGSPLSAQEIRHAMSKEKSRHFLKELSEMPDFDAATDWQYWTRKDPRERVSGRMTNRELVLRFCAFRNFVSEEYRLYASLDAYLVEFTKRIDGTSKINKPLSDNELEFIKNDFEKAMRNALCILGEAAFRRWPLTQKRKGTINRALFEAQAIALADYSTDELLPKKRDILNAFRKAFDSESYVRSITVGTGSPKAVEVRILETKSILSEVMK